MLEEHCEYILESLNINPQPVIAIVGPTCTGKTDLAIKLAQKLQIEIINCDSRLIFSEMNIGTAKPSEEELSTVKHHLVNIKKPNETYSAGEYRDDFDKVMRLIKFDPNRNEPQVLVVGGTGLYIRAALDNLEMPNISNDEQLRAELNALELNELLKLLDSLDPEAQHDIDTKNKVRVIRAIEIIKLSGKTLKENRSKSSCNRYNTSYFGLNFHKRPTLYHLIDERVISMLSRGLVHEVETLLNKYGITKTLLGTIGYKEIIGHLNQEFSLSQAISMIQKKTRLYAKRQMTWFNQNPELKWLYND
jgi:tRNA dimethylallyltransferase